MTSTDLTGPGPASPAPEMVTPGVYAGPDPVPIGADLATRVIRLPPEDPASMPAERQLGGQPYRLAPIGVDPSGGGPVGPHPSAETTTTTTSSDTVPTGPLRLVVVYDETCALCRKAREWLLTQTTFIPLELLAAGSSEARHRYGSLPWLGEELVVVDQDGRAWIGPAAFLMAMWATHRYRHWSYRLSGPAFAPLAEQFFHRISSKRRRIGAVLLTSGRSAGHTPPTHRHGDGSPECTHCARPGVPS